VRANGARLTSDEQFVRQPQRRGASLRHGPDCKCAPRNDVQRPQAAAYSASAVTGTPDGVRIPAGVSAPLPRARPACKFYSAARI